MLESIGLACVRGDRRLFTGVGFSLAPGELLHVRGRNGSGKTTLLRLICGLVRPESGEVRWDGEPVRELGDDYHRRVTFVGHHNAIKDDLTGRENLLVSTTLAGGSLSPERAGEVLAALGLKGHEQVPVKLLSQGQKRRTALARLLVADTSLWVLDEPFNALDVEAVATVQEAVRAHLKDGGMVMLTAHQDRPVKGVKARELNMEAYAP